MKAFKIIIAFAFISLASSSYAQMEVEVGGKVEAQVGFRGDKSTYPFLVPSSVSQLLLDPSLIDPGTKFEAGVKSAIVTDSLIDIWATGTYDYECLGRTTYGAKIELFSDPTANKYSMDSWEYRFPVPFSSPAFPGSIGYIPIFASLLALNTTVPFVNSAVPNPGPAREVKIFLENCLGKFEIGDTFGASKHLQVDAATIAVGNGGIAGDARLWANTLQLLGMFASADMITNKVAFYYVDTFFSPVPTTVVTLINNLALFSATFNGIGTEMRYSGKANYYTPRFAGFAVGVSYIPDTDIYGSVAQLSNVSRNNSPFGIGFKDIVEGGINYDCKIQDIGVKAAMVGEVGKAKRKFITTLNYDAEGGLVPDSIGDIPPILSLQAKDLKAYEFGIAFDYCGAALAGSYGVNKPLIEGLRDNKYWTIGASYTYCDFGISVNYMDNRQKSQALREQTARFLSRITRVSGQFTELKYRNFVVDLEYKVCDGLIPYASYANINVHQPFNAHMESKFNQSIGLLGLKVLF